MDKTREHAKGSLLDAMERERKGERAEEPREMLMAASREWLSEGVGEEKIRKCKERFAGFAQHGRTLDNRKKGELKTAQSEKRMDNSLG